MYTTFVCILFITSKVFGEDEVSNGDGDNSLTEFVDPLVLSYLEGIHGLADEELHDIE